jgi:hypothetical protein
MKKDMNALIKSMWTILINANSGIRTMTEMHLSGTNVLELHLRMINEITKLQTQGDLFFDLIRDGLTLNYDMSRQQKKINKIVIAIRNVKVNLQEVVNNQHPPQQVKLEVK